VAGNFLEQVRMAQRAAKTKPETCRRDHRRQPRRRGEAYSELQAGGVGSCVLRFFGFPDFVTGL
jgi:hypothetical protein